MTAMHNRRIAGYALLLVLASALLLTACRQSDAPAIRNLVVICIDTVRFDSFFNETIDDQFSPWIERAQHYENAQAPAPWTIPSVASFLTGQYPIEHGAGQFENEIANLDTGVPSPLRDEATTLAEILAAKHFRTGAFVSHPFFKAKLGLEQGFQVLSNRKGWQRDVEKFWQWADPILAPHRFFGYLHFMEAHHRHTRPPEPLRELLAEYDPITLQQLQDRSQPTACKKTNSRHCRQNMVYNGAVLELREAIATVLKDLEERKLINETLVVLYSDHGEEFWDHKAVQELRGEDSRKSFGIGHGQSLYQELLHVPLMVWHPGLEGKRHQELVSLVDVLPSITAWLGLEEVELDVSGQLLPPLGKSPSKSRPRQVWSSGIAYGPEKISTQSSNMKSIFSIKDDRFEFFDLDADPGEHSPIEDDGLIMSFDTLTGDYLDMNRNQQFASGKLDAEQLQDLKAIGYLQGVESETPPEPEPEQGPSNDCEEQEKDKP